MMERYPNLPVGRPCPIRECGAVVLLVPVPDGELAVDPQPVEIAVAGGDGYYRLETGFRPHWTTCVDVSGRGHKRAQRR